MKQILCVFRMSVIAQSVKAVLWYYCANKISTRALEHLQYKVIIDFQMCMKPNAVKPDVMI